jgi:4-diphosphocytidyl-2-C-methyl-D-erythritol kinase
MCGRQARSAEYISHPMLIIPAHAKLNLCLCVRGRRPDGYHEIDSVAVAVDWHDLVGVEVRPARETVVRLRLAGDDTAPGGDGNLAAQAARALATVAGPLAAELWLDKRVPSAAGLGGGSGDAAAVLRACARLVTAGALGTERRGLLTEAAVAGLAAALGSDVPLMLAGGTQRMRGRGTDLEPLPSVRMHIAVAIAGASGTASTYAAVEHADLEDGGRADAVAAALRAGRRPPDEVLGSGLEAGARRANPVLGERLAGLRVALPQARWHLTGSGGAAFALAATAEDAAALAASAREAGFPARACRTVSG